MTGDARRLHASTLVIWAAAFVLVFGVTVATIRWMNTTDRSVPLVLTFLILIAAGEFLRITLPNGRDAAPVGMAMALAMALLPELGPAMPERYGAGLVVLVTALGTGLGVSLHAAAGRAPGADVLARRLLSIATAAVLFRELPLTPSGPLVTTAEGWGDRRWAVAILMVVVALLAIVVDGVLAAAIRADLDHAPVWASLRDETRASVGIGSAVAATGVLIALAARPMGLAALPVFAIPLLITQFAFRRYAMVRATYRQTIRSLSRLTELGGYTETGHSQRVAALSLAMGRVMGMTERELLQLEYAALLHDIGQLSLADPIPGGATLVAARTEQRRIASLGADIVRQTGVLDEVAQTLEQQAEQYRHRYDRGAAENATVPLSSRIIKVANAFDDLVGEATEESRRLDAVERLHLGMAFEYDPRVVTALIRVLDRGVIPRL